MSGKSKNLPDWLKKTLGWGTWILIVLLLISTIRNVQRVKGIRSQVEKEEQKVAKMQAENAQLEEQIAVAEGTNFIEKQIRNKLGLVKPGEAIVVLPDAEILKKMAPQIVTEEDVLPDPIWRKWLKLFI